MKEQHQIIPWDKIDYTRTWMKVEDNWKARLADNLAEYCRSKSWKHEENEIIGIFNFIQTVSSSNLKKTMHCVGILKTVNVNDKA